VFTRSLLTWSAAALLAGCTGAAPESASTVSALAATPTATATAKYFGGSVTANAKVYVVWWGDPSKINSSLTAAHGGIADFYAGVTNSSYMDGLNQYDTNINAQAGSHMGMAGTGQHIGRGNYVASLTLTNIPSGNVTDAQIQTTLDQAFVAGTLPPPDDNTLYAIYFPSGVTISLDGSSSCSSFGAYHEAIIETQRHDAYYAVMPDCGSSFAGRTSVSSHELIEAITDNLPTPASSPDYPQAWNDSMGNEMGDLCHTSGTVTTDFGSFSVQTIWDERTQTCKTFSSDASKDFNVSVSPNVATVALNAPMNLTVKTAASVGAAQPLTLSASAPTGVTATVSPTTVMAGGTATLTVTATNALAQAVQIVVRADSAGTPVQTHTATLLLSSNGAPADLGAAPADLALAAPDLSDAPTDGGVGDDASSGGTGGGGGQPPPGHSGCDVAGASANASAIGGLWILMGLALVRVASRRLRQHRR
jgi:hypothetical protein